MRALTDLRIRTKLSIIIGLTCLIALLMAFVVIVGYDNYTYQNQKQKELSAQAEILASSMIAPLEFDDHEAATEYLKPLSTNPQILSAAVYAAEGAIFASYSKSNSPPAPNAIPTGIKIHNGLLSVSAPVIQNRNVVGSVYVQESIEPLTQRIVRYGGVFIMAIIISLFITLPIALRLHYAIANPVYARSLIEASLDPFITINPQGIITDVNSATSQVTGVSREELIGTDFSTYFTEPDKARDSYRQVFNEGSVTDFPLTIRHTDGVMVDVLYNASVYKDEHGKVLGVFAAARDVTAQKTAEREIHKRTAELQVANKELEAFSYSVSHDLRAPLRAIDGFSQALLEDCAGQLDQQGRGYLDRVRAASQRMGILIDDMLELARISRIEMQHTLLDLSTMANDILLELARNDDQRKVEWHIQPELYIKGDPRLIRVMMDNLLGNAWKYTSKQSMARIEVGKSVHHESGIEYFVKDNGAGFDMAYSEKLFGAFQRLHAVTEFPGTGVGLAIVQRIIHRHGGEVRGEGVPGQGAAFYFSLPD